MADILPFRGIRYDAAAVGGDIAAVAAPPYDVISPAEQQRLYDRHTRNVVRLILGREEDRYESASRLFREWLGDGTLAVDGAPSLYIYRQSFTDPVTGESAPERTGIVCLLKLEDYATGKVLPHENTITSHKADRLNLLRATSAQFESIYGLYSDPEHAVAACLDQCSAREVVVEGIDNIIGSSHTVERIQDPRTISTLQSLLRDKPVFIADGHHRYETGLNYRREIRETAAVEEGQSVPADYILITLTAFEDPGLLVLPTHRMVRGIDQNLIDGLLDSLAPEFSCEPIERESLEAAIVEASRAGRKAIGVALPGGKTVLALLTVPVADIAARIPGPGSTALKQLDVTILQRLILQDRLGISPEMLAAGGHVSYTRDVREAFDGVEMPRGGAEFQVSFILGRPSVEDVRHVSLAGDKMPQKSTFFYPKLLSGLIMRDLKFDSI